MLKKEILEWISPEEREDLYSSLAFSHPSTHHLFWRRACDCAAHNKLQRENEDKANKPITEGLIEDFRIFDDGIGECTFEDGRYPNSSLKELSELGNKMCTRLEQLQKELNMRKTLEEVLTGTQSDLGKMVVQQQKEIDKVKLAEEEAYENYKYANGKLDKLKILLDDVDMELSIIESSARGNSITKLRAFISEQQNEFGYKPSRIDYKAKLDRVRDILNMKKGEEDWPGLKLCISTALAEIEKDKS